jgi:predicted ArsR family transcriptional regulator
MDEATERWVEQVGSRFDADGLPRTAGRIAAYLLVSADACSLDDLASTLQLSKASVSTHTRLLERLGTIERVARAGDRRGFYRLPADLHTRMLQQWLVGLRNIHLLLVRALGEGVGREPAVRCRLETLADFYDHVREEVEGAGERWIRDHSRHCAGDGLVAAGTPGER